MKVIVLCLLAALAFAATAEETQENETGLNVGTPKGCNPALCYRWCLRHRNKGGICTGGNCYCTSYFFGLTEATSNLIDDEAGLDEGSPRAPCNAEMCHRSCVQQKKSGGICYGEHCICSNYFTSDVSKSASDETETDEGSPRLCIPMFCETSCKRNGRTGGKCYGSRCVCNGIF